MSKFETIKEAAQDWVRGFNAIPQEVIKKAYPDLDSDGLEILVTERECGYCGNTEFEENEDGEEICSECQNSAEEYAHETYDLPMWGTMWTFEEILDEDWARENLETLRECGFWVYDSEELGVLIVLMEQVIISMKVIGFHYIRLEV